MKYCLGYYLILLFGVLHAQDSFIYGDYGLGDNKKITVILNGNETFIETYYKGLESRSTKLEKNFSQTHNYRLGPSASNALKKGVITAIEWINLNEQHKKDFEKEICRFHIMNRTDFENHGYSNHLASEMQLLFIGKSDGSFEFVLKDPISTGRFIEFTEKELVNKFRNLLDGKSTNDEIDDIFKISNEIIQEREVSEIEQYLQKGKSFMESKNITAAINEYNKVLEIDPDNETALVSIAICHMTRGDWENAIEPCNKAIKINPGQAVAYFVRGSAKINTNQDGCLDFKKSKELGFEKGDLAYSRYCK